MCGIGGILRLDGEPIPDEWLDAIDARIAHRGPDGHGRFRDRVEFTDDRGDHRTIEVAFVHRRLSIIDHASGGQPMVSKRGRNDDEGLVAVAFNGCIYNHRDLRRELEGRGRRFTTDHSDTEVLIHGWREWDRDLFHELDGMYAFALWSRAERVLVLARDWAGEKPLYFWANDFDNPSLLVFSSMLPAVADVLHAAGELEANDAPWWLRVLHFGCVEIETPWRNLLPLTPGCAVFAPPIARPTKRIGHQLSFDDARKRERFDEPALDEQGFDDLLRAAVHSRLEADVPFGCFLSGGVDSSLIAHYAQEVLEEPLRTFSVRMPDARYDESAHAERVASHLGCTHETLDPDIHPAEDLVHLIEMLGLPFGDSSILPTYWISRAARAHVKVALSGDGGDELFLGYERYQAADLLARWRKLLRLIPSPILGGGAHPKSRRSKLARLGDAARHAGYHDLLAIFPTKELSRLVDEDLDSDGREPVGVAAAAAWDFEDYLPNDLLRKVDTASMAVALEVRAPLLARDVIEAALNAPVSQLMPRGQRKGLLRRIARKHLPPDVVDRPKMGFAIPIGEWFRMDHGGMRTLLLDHLRSAEPFGDIELNRAVVRRLIREHMSQQRDHGQRLFTLLTLSIWARSQANPA